MVTYLAGRPQNPVHESLMASNRYLSVWPSSCPKMREKRMRALVP